MTFAAKAATILGYRVLPTSILALLTYLSLFIALIVTDFLPSVPSIRNQKGLDLKEAYEDLRHITAHPHPYNSHANDHVRSYLLERIHSITQGYSYVHVEDDLRSNGSWAAAYGVYFEGTNILVKIDGTSNTTTGGILFSAHYDSVSTAPGATDDGMGVATLIQLVKYFLENRVTRTAVFNINNGEEDWLNGAHAFLEHPWSNLTDTFLNLEGAAAGGRPILFRATSTTSVRSFRNTKLVPHPHASVLSADAFSRGLIRSGTDFSVYTTRGPRTGMDGLDLAFYKGRSRYHTKYDAAQYTLGGEKALWNMMETARGVGIGLLGAPFDEKRDLQASLDIEGGDGPVYFDLFKSVLIVFPISRLFTFNVFALVIGPLVLILFILCQQLLIRSREKAAIHDVHEDHNHAVRPSSPPLLRHTTSQSQPVQESPHLRNLQPSSHLHHEDGEGHSLLHGGHQHIAAPRKKGTRWVQIFWRHAKFWVALGVTAGLQILLMWGYIALNPFAIYSSPYIVLASFLSLSYLTLLFTLTFPSSLPFYHPKAHALFFYEAVPPPAQQQKQTIFVHLYIFTWLLLILSTLGITKLHPGVGSGYLVSAWNLCVGAGCLLAAVEGIVLASLTGKPAARSSVEQQEENGEERYDELEGEESSGARPGRLHGASAEDPGAHADERTPLIVSHERDTPHDTGSILPASSRRHHTLTGEEDGGSLATWWWFPQFLVSVPIPVMLMAHVIMLVLDGMPQVLADGASAWGVYSLPALTLLPLALPLAPFAYKLRPFRPLTLFVLAIFVLSTVYTWLAFPFSPEDPLKVYFQQTVRYPPGVVSISGTIDPSSIETPYSWSTSTPLPELVTSLSGPELYLRSHLLPYLPSTKDGNVKCAPDPVRLGLTRCEWDSGEKMTPFPGVGPHPDDDDDDNKKDGKQSGERWNTNDFFKARVDRAGPTSARIWVKGRNTRSCRVYFDSGPVFAYNVHSSRGTNNTTEDGGDSVPTGKGMQKGYEVPSKGVPEVRLWSRTWEKEFVVDVNWGRTNSTPSTIRTMTNMNGRVACEWNEYESALIDNGPLSNSTVTTPSPATRKRAKIPAFEEVLTFLPEWAVATKLADGLVEAWAPFAL